MSIDTIHWSAQLHIRKYETEGLLLPVTFGEWDAEDQLNWLKRMNVSFVEDTYEKNLLMNGGASCLWETLIGNGTATAGQTLTYFNNGNAAIGVGDSSTAAAATQTNLQAATNKLRKGMMATYPTHTDGTSSGSASIVFKSSFGTSEANYVWNEWGVFNSATDGTGRMLNRKVENAGTKASGAVWEATVTLTLS